MKNDLKSFLPAEVYADFLKAIPEEHPESMFNSDEDREFYGLVLVIEKVVRKIGTAVFIEHGHTAEEAAEFYNKGDLDDFCALVADRIQQRIYGDFSEVEQFIRFHALEDVAQSTLDKFLES